MLVASVAVHHTVIREHHPNITLQTSTTVLSKINPHYYNLEKNDDPDKFLVCVHTKAGRLAFSQTNMQTVPNNFAPRVTNTRK